VTDQPRSAVARLCPCCTARFCPIGQPRCDDCQRGYAANRRAPTTPTAQQNEFSSRNENSMALDTDEGQP
jgi:hypothetical protein